MGNEASTPEQPHRSSPSPSTHYRSSFQTPSPGYTLTVATPGSDSRIPEASVATQGSDSRIPEASDSDAVVDPVLVGATRGAAAMRAKDDRLRRKPAPTAASDSEPFVDPVLAAAAAGAAAKRARDDRLRRKPTPSPQFPFRIEVDNEWKASLQRFAKTAASTARTVRSVAAPVLAEAAQAYQQASAQTQKQAKKELKPVKHDNPDEDDGVSTVDRELKTPEEPGGSVEVKDRLSEEDIDIDEMFREAEEDFDQMFKEAEELVEQAPEQSIHEQSEGYEYGTTKQSQKASPPNEKDDELEQPLKELGSPFTSPEPVRKQQVAPVVSTPEAFGGGYGSAYSTGNRRGSGNSTPGAQSPMSMDKMLHDSMDQCVGSGFSLRRRPHASTTDLSSVASSHVGDDAAWRQINFTERQQQLLATPKQFVELVSKKLSEERPRSSNNRYRRGRGRSSVRSFSATPTAASPSWMRNGALYADGKLFDRPLTDRSPSLSPPVSPISAAMNLEVPHKQAPEIPIVTLWDMIPSILQDSAPELVSEKSDTPVLPADMLKKTAVLDPSPDEFLDESKPSISQDYDVILNEEPTERTRKRKSEQDDKSECSSLFSGSLSSVGSLKRNKVDRKRVSWRRRMPTRSLLDKRSDHTRTPPRRTQKRDLAPKRFSRSLSPDIDSSMRKRRLVELDASGLFAEADVGSGSGQLPEDEDEMSNEALLTFSTMTNLSLTNAFPKIELPDELEYVASIRWRQLLANWKHQEMIDVMTRRPSSLHFTDHCIYNVDPTVQWSSSASTTSVDYYVRKHEKVVEKQAILIPQTNNLSGMTPSYPFELQTLSRFITHVGIPFADDSNTTVTSAEIKHDLEGEVTVDRLLHLVGEKHGKFSRLIDRLAVFASQDYSPSQMDGYNGTDNVTFSVDIKDAVAIEQKAGTKYDGELLQVKDALRAQVVFPTEGSLVCAFAFLNQYCSLSTSQVASSKIAQEIGLKSEIVRIKNLFAVISTGQPCHTDLPTGYRHLLLNVRIDDGVLAGKYHSWWIVMLCVFLKSLHLTIHAEIQFHLAPFYHILGEEGYHLHREILDAELDLPGVIDGDPASTLWDSPLPLLDSFVRHHSKNIYEFPKKRHSSTVLPQTPKEAAISPDRSTSGEKVATAVCSRGADVNIEADEEPLSVGEDNATSKAALSQSREYRSSDNATPTPPVPVATTERQAGTSEGLEGCVSKANSKSALASGGIAAAAAKGAATRMLAQKDDNDGQDPKPKSFFAGGGIAAAAAMAAASRSNQKKDEVSEDSKARSPFAGGGIAAAAAKAATARQKPQDPVTDNSEPMPANDGSVNDERKSKSHLTRQQNNEESINENPESKSPFAGSGIATVAAKTAAARQQKNEESANENPKVKSPFAGSGIAASAAMAAAARLKRHERESCLSKRSNDIFIPGITGKPRCLTPDREEDEDGLAKNNRGLSMPSLDNTGAETDDGDESPVAAGFFIPGITGRARCLTTVAATSERGPVATHRWSVSSSMESSSSPRQRSVSPQRERSESPIPKGSRRSLSPQRDSTVSHFGASERSPTASMDSSKTAQAGSTSSRRNLSSTEKLTSLSRYSPSTYRTNPYSRGGAHRGGRRHSRSGSDNSDGQGMDLESYSKSTSSPPSFSEGDIAGDTESADMRSGNPYPRGGTHRREIRRARSGSDNSDGQGMDLESYSKSASTSSSVSLGDTTGDTESADLDEGKVWEEQLRDPNLDSGMENRDLEDKSLHTDRLGTLERDGSKTPDSDTCEGTLEMDEDFGHRKDKKTSLKGESDSPRSHKKDKKKKKEKAEKKYKKKKKGNTEYTALVDDQHGFNMDEDDIGGIQPIQEEGPGNCDSFKVDEFSPVSHDFGEALDGEVQSKSPFTGGGIAAAAAQAAAARQQRSVEPSSDGENKPASPLVGGGIAAAASQAAATREKVSDSRDNEVRQKSPFAGGGIAAAAARQKKSVESPSDDEDKPVSSFTRGGIAAAAARKEASDSVDDKVRPKSAFAGGGIAAAAAQAAAARQKKSVESPSDGEDKPASPFAGGGIAAAAAQAAAARKKASASVDDEARPKSAFAGGGIAAAAAQAAAARQKKSVEASSGSEDKPASPFAGGGIAAAAAQAAAARKKASASVDDEARPKSAFAGGGIAAAAAQAAAARQKKSVEASSDGEDKPASPFAGGGIAAAAANQKSAMSSEKDESVQDSAIAGGGIAAAKKSATGWEDTGATSQISDSGTEVKGDSRLDCNDARLGDNELVGSGLTSLVDSQTLTRLQEMTLLRSLSLSNQAMSVGMAGWLEYGSSDLLDRSVDRAFEVMENLASLHAQQGRWIVAVDILRALVMKCEQHLPLYHPLTLVSMLDLAGALAEVSEKEKAKKISALVLQRLALYLSEQEEHFLDARNDWLTSPKAERIAFQEHSAADFVIMLAEFVKALLKLEKRDVLRLLRKNNSAVMLNHSVIADSLGVLANCAALNERAGVELLAVHNSNLCWSLACQYYRRAFEGWSKVGQTLHHPNTSALACGLARCLRETGESKKAIRILETVVSARQKEATRKKGKKKLRVTANDVSDLVRFLPPRTQKNALSSRAWSTIDDAQINALCLWSLAIYRVEENPDEPERIHALKLLHSSAEGLRNALKETDTTSSAACWEMLRCVEGEARELFQPLKAADADSAGKGSEDSDDDAQKNLVHNFKKRLERTARQIQGRFVSA